MRRDPTAPYLAALATVLGGATLLPVLTSSSWVPAALLMVVVTVGSGLALRAATRSPALVLLGQILVGLVVLTVLFARDTAVWGLLPGPAALSSLAGLVRDGMDGTRHYSTPAPPDPGIRLLLTGGMLGVAIAVDFLAVTWGTAVAAGLPLLALYCVPAAVLPHGASAVSFALVSGGWLLLLAHDGRLRVSSWGRTLARNQELSKRRFVEDDLEGLGVTARRLGALTVAAAILVPLLLPSLSNGLLTSGEGDGSGGGGGGRNASAVDPILTLRQNLTARSTTPVLTFQTGQANPPPLVLVTDDQFDGSTWRTSDGLPDASQTLDTDLPAPTGLGPDVVITPYLMKVKVTTLSQSYLPVPYPAKHVTVKGAWVYASDTLDVVGRGRTTKNLSYSATYLDVQPSIDQLATAPAPPEGLVRQYTQLPIGLDPSIAQTAHALTDKETTAYAKAVALQTWFRSTGNFVYSTNVDTTGTDAVATFLATKRGYCVQFSSAMAVMARILGIPARIAVGFLPGTKQSDGVRAVSLNDAHAWPELYFEGTGWVRFEPTPAVRTGAPPSYTEPSTVTNIPTGGSTAQTADPGLAASDQTLSGHRDDELRVPVSAAAPVTKKVATKKFPMKVLVVLALALLALVATPLAALWTRWRRRRRALDAPARAEAGWAELVERVGDLGVDLPGGCTPRQSEALLADRARLTDEPRAALTRVVRTVEQARYSARPPATVDLTADVTTVVRAVRASSDVGHRLRATVIPRSGTAGLLSWSARAGERLAGVDQRIARTGRSVTRAPGTRGAPRDRRIFGRRPH